MFLRNQNDFCNEQKLANVISSKWMGVWRVFKETFHSGPVLSNRCFKETTGLASLPLALIGFLLNPWQ